MVPLFKKGSKRDAANCRPIRLMSLVGKVMEIIIRDHTMTYIQTHKLIHQSQHGFLPGRSCQSNVFEFIETVPEEVDNHMDIAYLDFAKAFDKVPHERLLLKIKSVGINEKLYIVDTIDRSMVAERQATAGGRQW